MSPLRSVRVGVRLTIAFALVTLLLGVVFAVGYAGGKSNQKALRRSADISAAFDTMMQTADVAKFPPAYRYMAFRVLAAGRSLAAPIYCDGTLETDALYARYAAWLDAG